MWLFDIFATSKLVALVMGEILHEVTAVLREAQEGDSSSGMSVLVELGHGF